MIPQDELEAWAKLYDLAHESLDPLSERTEAAITELDLRLKEAYERLVPAKSVTFGKFKSEALQRIRALLKAQRALRRPRF